MARTKRGLPVPGGKTGPGARRPTAKNASTPGGAMLKGPVVGQRKQTAGPRTGAQKGLGKYRAATALGPGLPTAANARKRAEARAAGSGIDVGKWLDQQIGTRGASRIVPHTMKALPKGGVRGVVRNALR